MIDFDFFIAFFSLETRDHVKVNLVDVRCEL